MVKAEPAFLVDTTPNIGMRLNNIIFLIYGVPLAIVYGVSVVSIISVRKALSATFVSIYVLAAVVNLLTYLHTWLALRLYQEPFFNFYYHFANRTFVLSLLHQFLVGYFYFAQNISSCLLTIDRFVHVAKREWIEVWQRRWWLLAIFMYSIVVPVDFFVAGYDTYNISAYIYDELADTFTMKPRTGPRVNLFIDIQAIFGIVVVAFCASMNIISFAHLSRINKSHMNRSVKADRSFFFISLTIFISQTCNVIIVVLFVFFYSVSHDDSMLGIVGTAMLYTSDIFSLGPGLYTLLVPGPIRRATVKVVLPAARVSPSVAAPRSRSHPKGDSESSPSCREGLALCVHSVIE